MITAKVLNSGATLNSYKIINSVDFIAGAQVVIRLQLWDTLEDLRYIPISGATLSLIFNLPDGAVLTKAATLDANDRSMATITLTASDTDTLFGGNAQISLVEGGNTSKGLIFNLLQKISLEQ